MRDDLGVGLRGEDVAGGLEALAQRLVVLDDAVVDDGDLAVGDVRMRVGRRGRAVRRPARVRDAGVRGERARIGLRGEIGDARRAHQPLEVRRRGIVADDREAGRVVAAVLEPSNAVDQDGNDVPRGRRSDDAAHGVSLSGASVSSTGRFQPGTLTWRGRATVSVSAGASREMVLPPPIVAPRPIRDRRDQHAVRPDARVVVDHGPMLVRPVVVRRDRSRAEVHAGAHGRVADVGQMVGLRPAADGACLDFDEIAHVNIGSKIRARAQARVGADPGIRHRSSRPRNDRTEGPARRRRL